MPRQKFCSVSGCLSTTETIKKEQTAFLAAFCSSCNVKRPCRCPAPDIYTTRKETQSKFKSWCKALGLTSPGYYINVCYKHFSKGCPTRTCPDPDLVEPVWEKHFQKRKVVVKGDSNNNKIGKVKSKRLTPRRTPKSAPKRTSLSSTAPLHKLGAQEYSNRLPEHVMNLLNTLMRGENVWSSSSNTISLLPKVPLDVHALKDSTVTSINHCIVVEEVPGHNVDDRALIETSIDPCLNEGHQTKSSVMAPASPFCDVTDQQDLTQGTSRLLLLDMSESYELMNG